MYAIKKPEIVTEAMLKADIRQANYEMLLFITVFGDQKLKELAKAELQLRYGEISQDDMDSAFSQDLSVAAHC
jgi:hypothetical protein